MEETNRGRGVGSKGSDAKPLARTYDQGKDGKGRLVRMGLGKSERVDAGGVRGEGDKEYSQANGGSEDRN